jgi:hypothetical protein
MDRKNGREELALAQLDASGTLDTMQMPALRLCPIQTS